MGVAGSGKTTLATSLADVLGWDFLEGDSLHPPANIEQMARGTPLTDDDRGPWLEAIGRWLDVRRAAGESAVVTCSALRRSYRELLRAGRPGVRFCHVVNDPAVLAERLGSRQGHYMPSSLLASQLATLEPLSPDEPGVTLDGDGPPDRVVRAALDALGLADVAHSAEDERLR
ncbi:MAG: gluconokinase [Nocardioides sp.]|nr:gluconokinase [Nocardioides sp.]